MLNREGGDGGRDGGTNKYCADDSMLTWSQEAA